MTESREEFIARVRAFETCLRDNMRNIFCPTHLSLGQESVAADVREQWQPGDWCYATHRNHHFYLACGGSEERLRDEIMGLPTGLNGGFSGSQGFSDTRINFHATAIVGGLVGAAVGTAYAIKMDGLPAVVVCCVGDAGTEAGVFWESLNFAALYKLPVAFIIENNGMSVDAPIAERQATPIGGRLRAFGIEKCISPQAAIATARFGTPAFYEAFVKLEADHLNMASLLPRIS